MASSRWALTLLAIGSICIAIAFAMPAPPDPRLNWTDEKSVEFQETQGEMHSLSHALADAANHSGDPAHVHSPGEATDPRLTALELEKAHERSASLHEQLEAARQIPAAWNLLLGVVGALFMVVGGVLAIAMRASNEPQGASPRLE